MTPENPAPGAQSGGQPQSRPDAPGPGKPAAPGSPAPAPAPVKRDQRLILTRIAILIGAVVLTFVGLGGLSYIGATFGRMIVGRMGWEKIKIKSPTPSPPPLPSAVFGDPKSLPTIAPPLLPKLPQETQPLPAVSPPATPVPIMTPSASIGGAGRG